MPLLVLLLVVPLVLVLRLRVRWGALVAFQFFQADSPPELRAASTAVQAAQ